MGDTVTCEACHQVLDRHCSYVARIDIFADPCAEPIDTTGGPTAPAADSMQAVLDSLKNISADQAMDDVHRRFEFHLCKSCQRKMLGNPLGLPRATASIWDGRN